MKAKRSPSTTASLMLATWAAAQLAVVPAALAQPAPGAAAPVSPAPPVAAPGAPSPEAPALAAPSAPPPGPEAPVLTAPAPPSQIAPLPQGAPPAQAPRVAPPVPFAPPFPPATSDPAEARALTRAMSVDPVERQAAAWDLARAQTGPALHLLTLMLTRDWDPRVRWAAASALGSIEDPWYRNVLTISASADPDPAVRAAAQASHDRLLRLSRRPRWAAGYSLLCPGCGYFYLGEPRRALAYLGSSGLLVAGGVAAYLNDAKHPLTGETIRDADDAVADVALLVAQNLWFYGVFAAYRDARLARGDAGYKYPVARERLAELVAAPFNPRVLKKPWVWAGLPLMLGAAVGFTFLVSSFEEEDASGPRRTSVFDGQGVNFLGRRFGTWSGLALGEGYFASMFVPVGVGEEALFRGVIQAGLSETSLGLWGGWAVSSAIFGGVHALNFIGQGEAGGWRTAAYAVPYLIMTGSYLGVVYIKTDFSLLAGTALHFWYDFGLSTISFMLDPDGQPFVARWGFPF